MFIKKCFLVPLLGFLLLIVGNCPPLASNDKNINTHKKVALIFDMDGVLITTDSKAAFSKIGTKVCLHYAGSNLKNVFNLKSLIHTCFFDFLYALKPGTGKACDAQGHPLPFIMCDWLAGHHTGADILAIVETELTNNSDAYSQAEDALLRSLSTMTFTPESFIATRAFFDEAIELVQTYKDQDVQLYILSNWDKESFQLLKEQHPEFFALFDGIVISGDVGLIKPDLSIYNHTIKTHGLDPKNCIVIDDRPENIAASQELCMHGILCESHRGKPDFDNIKEQIDAQIAAIEHNRIAVS